MRRNHHRSAVDDRETMIRLTDIIGHELIFAPYHIETPLPPAPGLLALVRPSAHRTGRHHSVVHPPWWDVLYIEQAKNVCRRAGRLLCDLQYGKIRPTRVMVHWMPDAGESARMEALCALVKAHDPELNRRLDHSEAATSLAAC